MANFMSNFQHLRPFFALLAAVLTLLPYNELGAQNVAQGVKVIVIDAGHGGARYPGATYNGVMEKDINLQVALKLGALIEKNLPDVKVVYTRTTDAVLSNVLADDLQGRADIAHKNDGDIFISIHSNASSSSATRGVETIIMGETEREQTANQNSLYLNNKDELLDMSDQRTAAIVRAYIQNLQFTYGEYSEMMARLIQEEYSKLGLRNRGIRRQPLKVLYATDMPSVLTEIGFMSNEEDFAYITSEKGQQEITEAIFRAVKSYVANVRRALLLDTPPPPGDFAQSVQPARPTQGTTETTKQKSRHAQGEKRFTIQLLASNKLVSTSHHEFKSYGGKVWILECENGVKYKYCLGDYADKALAQHNLEEVRKEFPSAFIISFIK